MKVQDVSVLIIDDVNAMRLQIQALLNQVGFEKLHFAANGVEARAVLGLQVVNLILCDWHMEPMTGFQLLQDVRSDPKFMDIGFIMVTAEMTKENVVRAIQAAVDEYLVKPLTVEQVQGKIFKVLVKRKVLE